MTKRQSLCPTIALLVVFISVWNGAAQTNWEYLPFVNGKPLPKVSLVKYTESKSNVWVHPSDPKNFATIEERLENEDADFTTVILRVPNGRTFRTCNDFVLGPYLSEVYSGDFNQDGVPDFLAIKPSGGNGIGCWQLIGLFAISENGGYRFTRITSWGLGPASPFGILRTGPFA